MIATAGDVVDITEDGLTINGAPQQEHQIYEKTQRYDTGVDFPIKLQEGQIFVLGDSRENASDSRVYGAVDVKDTKGKSYDDSPKKRLLISLKNLLIFLRIMAEGVK